MSHTQGRLPMQHHTVCKGRSSYSLSLERFNFAPCFRDQFESGKRACAPFLSGGKGLHVSQDASHFGCGLLMSFPWSLDPCCA
eukprot:1157490-Pelagomonas_calceolata.AAC.16